MNLSLPLFKGFSRTAELDRQRIQYKDIEEQQRMTIMMAQNEVASAEEELNKIFETASARKQALEQANTGYDRAKKRLQKLRFKFGKPKLIMQLWYSITLPQKQITTWLLEWCRLLTQLTNYEIN